MIELRPYQFDIINEVREHLLAGRRSVLIQAPTGSGKTALTAHMIATAIAKQRSAWFCVHRRELVNQSIDTLENSAALNVGVIAAGFGANGYHRAQVASIQTLMRRWTQYTLPDLLIIDETHHVISKSWSALLHSMLERKPSMRVIGLTATPTRLDGRGLGEWFEVMVQGPSTAQLIADGWLSKYKMFAPSRADLREVHTVAGDYNKSELDGAMRGSTVTGDAIAEYKQRCMGKRALMFLWSVQASSEMAQAFNEQGIPAAHIDGDTSDALRDKDVRDFRDGRILVLTNCEIVTEGFDLPAIEACFLLRPTQSLGLYLQMVGRCLRPGKEYALIMDHAGLAFQHGLPDQDREWTLQEIESRDKKKIANPVRQCMKCYAVMPARMKRCKECGYGFEIQPREVNREEGQLVEIDMAAMSRMFHVKESRDEQRQALDLDDLKRIEKRRGYKPGWAEYVMRAREAKKYVHRNH